MKIKQHSPATSESLHTCHSTGDGLHYVSVCVPGTTVGKLRVKCL